MGDRRTLKKISAVGPSARCGPQGLCAAGCEPLPEALVEIFRLNFQNAFSWRCSERVLT